MTEFRAYYGLLMAMVMTFGVCGVAWGAKRHYPSQPIPEYQERRASEPCGKEAHGKTLDFKNKKAQDDVLAGDQEVIQKKYKVLLFESNQQDNGGADQSTGDWAVNNNGGSQQIDGNNESGEQEGENASGFEMPDFVQKQRHDAELERIRLAHEEDLPVKHQPRTDPALKSLKNYRAIMALRYAENNQQGWWLWEKVDDLRNKLPAEEQHAWLKRLKEEPFMQVEDAFLEKHAEISRALATAFLESLLDEGVKKSDELAKDIVDEGKKED